MTELERILKETLTTMEREMTAALTAAHEQDRSRATGISAALAALERYTREIGTALVAFERHIERQIEQTRERQRSRGPGISR